MSDLSTLLAQLNQLKTQIKTTESDCSNCCCRRHQIIQNSMNNDYNVTENDISLLLACNGQCQHCSDLAALKSQLDPLKQQINALITSTYGSNPFI